VVGQRLEDTHKSPPQRSTSHAAASANSRAIIHSLLRPRRGRDEERSRDHRAAREQHQRRVLRSSCGRMLRYLTRMHDRRAASLPTTIRPPDGSGNHLSCDCCDNPQRSIRPDVPFQ